MAEPPGAGSVASPRDFHGLGPTTGRPSVGLERLESTWQGAAPWRVGVAELLCYFALAL